MLIMQEPLITDSADVGSTPCWLFNNALYLVESQLNSFKGSLEYFKAEKVKYWPNLPELLTGNIC